MSVICGGTLSNVTGTLTVALLPAVSVAITMAVFEPSVNVTWAVNAPLTICVDAPLTVTLATARLSVTVPLTVMGELANS